jgi:hypothetical protein
MRVNENIRDGSITTSKLALNSIDNTVIKANSVSTDKIVDSSITPLKLDTTGSYIVSALRTTGSLVVDGDLVINGTTTTFSSDEMVVKDKNITLNYTGTTITAEGSGLSIEGDASSVVGSLIYKSWSPTKFAIGSVGSEDNIVCETSNQTLTNKTYNIKGVVITVGGMNYTDIESAVRAINEEINALPIEKIFEGDSNSPLYNSTNKTINISGASEIRGVYIGGIRMRSGVGNDYTVLNGLITLVEAFVGNFTIIYY